MPDTSGAKVTTLSPSFVARVAQGLRYVVAGVTPQTWMGPSQPLTPVAQDAEGRQFDYPVGFNLRTQPRDDDHRNISFDELRGLADTCDLVRLAIETRKDQVERIEWNVKERPVANGGASAKKNDPRIKRIEAFLQFPDGINPFATWLRMLLEDLLVIDAPTIYRRRNLGGELFSLDVVDGATIKRVLDERGRTPLAPSVAYQQVLKGLPAVDYTTNELLYLPRNPRSNRVYGFSPVEQIVTVINISLRKQISELAYFTEGNTPEALIGVPDDWSVQTIKEFQEYWDGLLEGNLAQRRHTKFVPGGLKYQPTRATELKDDYSEWLARIVCFAFSLPPTAFTRQVNRATAQTAKQAAAEEGLAPLLGWVKRLLDSVIAQDFGAPDLEFAWKTEEELDPAEQANIDKLLVSCGVKTINEARSGYALDPVADGDDPVIITGTGAVRLSDALNPPEPAEPQPEPGAQPDPKNGPDPQPKKKVQKRAGPKRLNRNRAKVAAARATMRAILTPYLAQLARHAARDIPAAYGKRLGKADAEPANDDIVDHWHPDWWALTDEMQPAIEALTRDGAHVALLDLGVSSDGDITAQANEDAIAHARSRAAELVGKRWEGGKLVDNPDATKAISSTTRDMLRGLVANAEAEGWSNEKLASAIQESAAFSPARARLIARTEAAMADVAGNLIAWKASGVVTGKRSLISSDGCCDLCGVNEAAGAIALDETFPSGDQASPFHPNCECDVMPVTDPAEME